MPQGGLIAGMLFGRNGEFGVEDICDLRFCGRSIGLLVLGSLKRGPLAVFSDNSERFLCREAPLWHFLPVSFLCGAFLPRCFLLGGDDVGPDPMCQVGKVVRLIVKISR